MHWQMREAIAKLPDPEKSMILSHFAVAESFAIAS